MLCIYALTRRNVLCICACDVLFEQSQRLTYVADANAASGCDSELRFDSPHTPQVMPINRPFVPLHAMILLPTLRFGVVDPRVFFRLVSVRFLWHFWMKVALYYPCICLLGDQFVCNSVVYHVCRFWESYQCDTVSCYHHLLCIICEFSHCLFEKVWYKTWSKIRSNYFVAVKQKPVRSSTCMMLVNLSS